VEVTFEMAADAPARAGRRPLAELTTIGLGGPAPSVETARDAAEVAELVAGRQVLVLGGGSNVVIADAGVAVPVVRVAIPGLSIEPVTDDDPALSARFAAIARIGAGEDWDSVVARLVADGWCGVEALSGIPGLAGATPVQNVGAYGAEIADVLVDVEVVDRSTGVLRRMPPAELELGYRSSVLRGTDTAVVTEVRIGLSRTPRPVAYGQAAAALGIEVGEVAPPAAVRAAVLRLRRSKGMVIDPADPDTRSVGSFFVNPVMPVTQADHVAARAATRLGGVVMPRYPAGDAPAAGVKLSAAWLIERAGFPPGYAQSGARVAVSGKHCLALTNRGGGTATEIVALAREIRDGVRAAFGVRLRPEPVLVGLSL
jgi:UDP-N-acetylmuramate dehydrogenase